MTIKINTDNCHFMIKKLFCL